MNSFKPGLALTALWLAVAAVAGPLNVVTTTPDLRSIAATIAGESATVSSIATGLEDPHFLQAKPSFIMRARRADLWIRTGMDLEIGWEPAILDGARNPRIRVGAPGHLDASQTVIRLEVPHEHVSRAMGDVHPSGNPHYLLDPLNGRLVAAAIAARLTQLTPQHADAFKRNLSAFTRDLDARMFGAPLVDAVGGDALWALVLNGKLRSHLASSGLSAASTSWWARMQPHRGAEILAYHGSWVYFTNRFGLAVAGELEPKPGVPPSPGHLAEVVKLASDKQLKVILQAPYRSRRGADFVAARSDAAVVIAAGMVGGSDAAKDYLSMLDEIVHRVSAAL
jgi:zinc/manganese transport system substrate-binding protein